MRELYLLLASTTIGLDQYAEINVPFDADAATFLMLQVCVLLLCVAVPKRQPEGQPAT